MANDAGKLEPQPGAVPRDDPRAPAGDGDVLAGEAPAHEVDGLKLIRTIVRDGRRFLTDDGILLMEIGRNRRALERAFPRIPFTWIETSGGPDMVFLLHASEMPG